MGWRFRKSINLGGGFRINLSKSGIGYSWGLKGVRITRKSNGACRTTFSIPGTGISHVTEHINSRKLNKDGTSSKNIIENSNYCETKSVQNGNVLDIVSFGLENMLEAANNALMFNLTAKIVMAVSLLLSLLSAWFLLITLLSVAAYIYIHHAGIIDLEYVIDEEQKAVVQNRLNKYIRISNSKRIWRISQTNKVINAKYEAGASRTVKRHICKSYRKVPFPFKTSSTAITFKLGKETLILLPDKVLLIQGNKVGAINYEDISINAHNQRFIENDKVPSDSQIVGYTWQYVNKSGAPDKRFKNNKKIPICLYGEIEIKSDNGINTIIMFSNPNI